MGSFLTYRTGGRGRSPLVKDAAYLALAASNSWATDIVSFRINDLIYLEGTLGVSGIWGYKNEQVPRSWVASMFKGMR